MTRYLAIELGKAKRERVRGQSRFAIGHGAGLRFPVRTSARPDILHFDPEGQSSQRDQRAGGKSIPIPSTIDIDLSGCKTWPRVTLTPIDSAPAKRWMAACARSGRLGSPARNSPAAVN